MYTVHTYVCTYYVYVYIKPKRFRDGGRTALPGLGPTRPEAQTIRPAFRPFGRLPPRPDRAG